MNKTVGKLVEVTSSSTINPTIPPGIPPGIHNSQSYR